MGGRKALGLPLRQEEEGRMHLFGHSAVPGGLARSLLAIAIASTLATGLAACGGGGGDNVRPVAPT